MAKAVKPEEAQFFAELDELFVKQYGSEGKLWLAVTNEDVGADEDMFWNYLKMACDLGYQHGYINGKHDEADTITELASTQARPGPGQP